jgi:hypothetical protein
VFFRWNGGRRPGFAGAFVEDLVFHAIFAYGRMTNAHIAVGRNVRNETEWEIYTEVLARFLGVSSVDLRNQLINEWTKCRDFQLCSNRIFFWAYRKARPW